MRPPGEFEIILSLYYILVLIISHSAWNRGASDRGGEELKGTAEPGVRQESEGEDCSPGPEF